MLAFIYTYSKPLLLICIVSLYPLYAFLHLRPKNFSDMGWPAWPRMVYGREYWPIYSGPGCLAIPSPSPVWERETTWWRERRGWGGGLGATSNYGEKARSSWKSFNTLWCMGRLRTCLSFSFIRFPPPQSPHIKSASPSPSPPPSPLLPPLPILPPPPPRFPALPNKRDSFRNY